ncbi:MAG: hypothetical protein H6622_08780 [Halobacteriovoraceae bacterium]|nr:hypothetical protein [Halobacteriovoraceae bacterium]
MDRRFSLIPFTKNSLDISVDCNVQIENLLLKANYSLAGDIDKISFPQINSSPQRKDNLWTTTCFELFIKYDDLQYLEFNFSPSQNWNVYHFKSYRDKSPNVFDIDNISIESTYSNNKFSLAVGIDHCPFINHPKEIHPCAVIEIKNSETYYYSNIHLGNKPDFHQF